MQKDAIRFEIDFIRCSATHFLECTTNRRRKQRAATRQKSITRFAINLINSDQYLYQIAINGDPFHDPDWFATWCEHPASAPTEPTSPSPGSSAFRA
jgi:hypothetical protein